MRNKLVVAVCVAYAGLALVAAARGSGLLSLTAMVVMLVAMNLWMPVRSKHLDDAPAKKAPAH